MTVAPRARRPYQALPATPLTEDDFVLQLREAGITELGDRNPVGQSSGSLRPLCRENVGGVLEPRSQHVAACKHRPLRG